MAKNISWPVHEAVEATRYRHPAAVAGIVLSSIMVPLAGVILWGLVPDVMGTLAERQVPYLEIFIVGLFTCAIGYAGRTIIREILALFGRRLQAGARTPGLYAMYSPEDVWLHNIPMVSQITVRGKVFIWGRPLSTNTGSKGSTPTRARSPTCSVSSASYGCP